MKQAPPSALRPALDKFRMAPMNAGTRVQERRERGGARRHLRALAVLYRYPSVTSFRQRLHKRPRTTPNETRTRIINQFVFAFEN